MRQKLQYIFEAQQFTPQIVEEIFSIADRLEKQNEKSLQGKIMASLFFEPSTRTRLSFESAMLRLGGEVIGTENALSFSSAAKGEPLEDTIRVLGAYADVIVLRYFEKDIAKRLAHIVSVPIINAGDGAGQHPTQALLDLYTIKRELGRSDDLSIAMVGDPKHSRSVHSLSYLLAKYRNITISFVAPPQLQLEGDLLTHLQQQGVSVSQTENLDEVISQVDIVYRNRLQKERFEDQSLYEKYKEAYLIDTQTVAKMKEGAILMDPLPRVGGIAPEVDELPQAKYFKQPYYGLLIRMALLQYLLT